MTLSIMTFNIPTYSITTLTIMAFVITSPSIMAFSKMTLKIITFDAYVVMLNGIMLRVMTPKSTCCIGMA